MIVLSIDRGVTLKLFLQLVVEKPNGGICLTISVVQIELAFGIAMRIRSRIIDLSGPLLTHI